MPSSAPVPVVLGGSLSLRSPSEAASFAGGVASPDGATALELGEPGRAAGGAEEPGSDPEPQATLPRATTDTTVKDRNLCFICTGPPDH